MINHLVDVQIAKQILAEARRHGRVALQSSHEGDYPGGHSGPGIYTWPYDKPIAQYGATFCGYHAPEGPPPKPQTAREAVIERTNKTTETLRGYLELKFCGGFATFEFEDGESVSIPTHQITQISERPMTDDEDR